MGTFETEIIIHAAVQEVWQALGEIGDIHLWNPGVQTSHTTSSGEIGLGASRYCDLGSGNFLDEQVVAWVPNEKLTMRITDTNMPFETADIRFTLHPVPEGTRVALSPIYKIKFGAVGKLIDKFYVEKTYKKGMNDLLAGLKNHIEGERIT